MNRDAVLTVGVTLCCLLVIGQAAGALDSAVETTPEDAITVGYSLIPLDRGDVDQLKEQLRPEEGESASRPEESESEAQSESEAPQRSEASGGASAESSGASSSDRGASNAGGGGSTPAGSLLELLRQLLEALLGALLAVLPFLGVIVAAAVGVRYRETLLDRVRSVLSSLPGAGRRSGADQESRPRPNPSNVVATRWFEMVRRLGLADRLAATPRECTNAAIEAGVDPDPVERLTALFEEVRYGEEPVTEARRHLSREALREFLDQYSDGGNR